MGRRRSAGQRPARRMTGRRQSPLGARTFPTLATDSPETLPMGAGPVLAAVAAEESRQKDPQCLSAGSWGKRWSTPSCEAMFGAAGPAGNLGSRGAPRWKQRALYDAIKDAYALSHQECGVARVSVYDQISGTTLGQVLEGRSAVEPTPSPPLSAPGRYRWPAPSDSFQPFDRTSTKKQRVDGRHTAAPNPWVPVRGQASDSILPDGTSATREPAVVGVCGRTAREGTPQNSRRGSMQPTTQLGRSTISWMRSSATMPNRA